MIDYINPALLGLAAYQIGYQIHQSGMFDLQTKMDNYDSKFKLNCEFIVNKLGIENIPNPRLLLNEYQTCRNNYDRGISALKTAEDHKAAGTIMHFSGQKQEEAPLPFKVAAVALTAFLMYAQPWQMGTCFVTVVTGAVVFLPSLVENYEKTRADKVITYLGTEGGLDSMRCKLENAEKSLKTSIEDLKEVKIKITEKMNEDSGSSEEEISLRREAKIQLTKIDLILSDLSLSQQEGRAPA